MLHAKCIDGQIVEYPYDLGKLLQDHPNTSFPRDLHSMPDLHLFGVVPVAESAPPVAAAGERVDEVAPAVVGGVWVQQWMLRPATQDELDLAARKLAALEQSRIAKLWQAAHDYEFAQISGSTIGLLTMGVMARQPKCVAVQDWIKSIWTLYYTRKATGEASTDFSSCGQCPHTVPELMAELGF